jgi:hypothetical protein
MKRWISLFLLVGSLLLVATVQAATTAPAKPKAVKIVEPYVKVGLTKASYNGIVSAVTAFVNENLLADGEKVSKVVITKKSGLLYFVDITLPGGTVVKSAFFKDNSKGGIDYFFPTAMNVPDTKAATKKAKEEAKQNNQTAPVAGASLPKSDKPVVEVFVMTYCPYGTQIEKGLLPVMKALGEMADIQIKFVSYTMHGAKEFTENLAQYCINKEQPTKFWPYLECFLKEADSAGCLASNNIDTAKVTACATATTEQYQLVSTGTNFPIHKDANVKYGVQGSPTLVINGVEANSGRDSASLLKTICSAFNTQPAACATVLSSATPAPGFGTGTTNSTAAASCN